MNTILKSLKALFRPVIVVKTYRRDESNWRKKHEAKLQQMAREQGFEWRSYR